MDKNKIIHGSNRVAGDVLIGLASSGIHSNGFSLVRKLLGESKEELARFDDRLSKPCLETILTPTRIYVKTVLNLISKVAVKGIAHITGGGFIENIPRIFPKGIGAEIDLNSYELPEIFKLLKELSGLDNQKIYNTFNMGIGMVICVKEEDKDETLKILRECGEKAYVIGKTVDQEGIKLLD